MKLFSETSFFPVLMDDSGDEALNPLSQFKNSKVKVLVPKLDLENQHQLLGRPFKDPGTLN
jgi:hypothetical protein